MASKKLRDVLTFSRFGQLVKDSEADRLLSVDQAAERLGATAKELRAWAAQHLVPAELVGGQYVFRPRALLTWLFDRGGFDFDLQRTPAKPKGPARTPSPAETERKIGRLNREIERSKAELERVENLKWRAEHGDGIAKTALAIRRRMPKRQSV